MSISIKKTRIKVLVASFKVIVTSVAGTTCFAHNPIIQTKHTTDTVNSFYNDFKVIEFTNPSTSLAFGVNPKLLSFSTKEPILPILWQDNYYALMQGEKRTVEMKVDASLIAEGKILFKVDGWNLKTPQEQEVIIP